MPAIVLSPPRDNASRSTPLRSIESVRLAGSSKPLPSSPRASLYLPLGPRPSTSRVSRPPSAWKSQAPPVRVSHVSLGRVLQEPQILANLLRYIYWPDFHSLALTCTPCSNVLQHPELRDVVLSAFVPGYRDCLRLADPDASCDISIELDDLNDFMISQQLPLHHYPTHALATLSASSDIAVLEDMIQRYVLLCQAHSRMVLLLQALIHSSLSPVQEELEDPSSRYRNAAHQYGRELVFPAPLSFFNDGNSKDCLSKLPTRGHIKFFSMPSASGRKSRSLEGEFPRRNRSRMSMLGRNKVPPPPPSADSLGFKLYSGSWRGPRRWSTITGPTSGDDDTLLRRPQLRFKSRADSSGSSTDNGQGSPSPASTRRAEFLPTSPPAVHSPHDIRTATSRLRAPILRVYFPCSDVDHSAIAACEAQLDDAGLWQHLSVGDIVCNLGYLPRTDIVASSSGSDLSSDGTRGPEPWMIFDGTGLVSYSSSAVLPLAEPLSLPSPLYYAHITLPPVNPRFIAALPRAEPDLSLMLLPATVRSPHSPNGFARIKKYQWLARLRPQVRPGLGEGWHCEWVLEGEGTKEGRQSLLDALGGNDSSSQREWKLVMEKCTPTRIWLKLV